jgi:ABC-type Fe3+-siderophore transport system permease subunit
MRRNPLRSVIISLVIILISFFNFYRGGGTETIKTVQIVSLLVCGMAIGIFIKSLVEYFRDRKNSTPGSD